VYTYITHCPNATVNRILVGHVSRHEGDLDAPPVAAVETVGQLVRLGCGLK
jgi:hypothetical protein